MGTGESHEIMETKSIKIATLDKRNSDRVFYSLMHQINVDSLRTCFNKLDGRKAIGVDGVDKEQYNSNLQNNLENLITRMKQMAYRPGPVRQVLIPKDGSKNATRPIGISCFEDKLVQRKVQEILESIYEPIFLDSSYGFRPRRNCHDAIKDLHQYIFNNEVEYVLDVDISNYFGSIDRKLLRDFLQKKIRDTKFLRYITRMFKAGILTDGELMVSEEGVVQGSCCSPVLANVYAHYVIDEWFEENQKEYKGPMKMFRFADDLVMCFSCESDAVRMKEALAKRLAEFNLKLNAEKTKLVKFARKKYNRGIKQEAFNFLGFTFYLGKSKKGYAIPKVKTEGKRMRAKLKKVNEWARGMRSKARLKEIWRIFCSKLKGHIQYYGVSFNSKAIGRFRKRCILIMYKWLNRRSQRRTFSYEEYWQFVEKYPPPEAKVVHRLF